MLFENIELDDDNAVFNRAADIIRYTNRNIFLTGRAGTGKTTFLKYIRKNTDKKTVVLAPTGVAAINAGGQTVHSFFRLDYGVYLPDDVRLREVAPKDDPEQRTIRDVFFYNNDKARLIKSLELLIIDEISMLRCDILDAIDKLLRHFRDWQSEPFGGVQVLLIGDPFQLPPIAGHDEWRILETFYDSTFFFSSNVIRENPPLYIELKKIYRQTDPRFIRLLNNIRINALMPDDLSLLESRYMPAFHPADGTAYITLATHNRIVDDINRTKLELLPAEKKTFEAMVTGVFPDEIMPTNRSLHLKEGAQVLFVKNNMPHYYNGQMGTITAITEDEMIINTNGRDIAVGLMEWSNIRYTWNRRQNRIDEEIIGTFMQFPLKLAWAITVHKSQGLTFDNVIADVGAAFTHGQVYVALSRCRNLEGLVLRSKVDKSAIRANPQALLYARNELSDAQLAEVFDEVKAGLSDENPAAGNSSPAALPDMDIHKLFETVNAYFCNKELLFAELYGKLNALLANNSTVFAGKIRSLEWKNEDLAVFIFFFHLYVNLDEPKVSLSDLEELFDRKHDYRVIRLALTNKTHPAFASGYFKKIEDSYCLSKKALKAFLSEILPEAKEAKEANDAKETKDAKVIKVPEKQSKSDKSDNYIMDYRSINTKGLFYNAQEREQITALTRLLEQSNFVQVQQRLSEAGMRKGFACIFYGAPGTGKTETVYQIARLTGRNIFTVNISDTKSMWFGESEKKIKEVFDLYRRYADGSSRVPILLFNEADAVIGRRIEGVSRAVDQTENAIQNIILQEMEQLEGIMIATTNLTQNLDPAFERRFLYKVEFRRPTPETRREIWQALIPALSAEDASVLADTYDFSGGDMENIARKSAVDSILRGSTLTLADYHRLCREEKSLSANQRAKVGFI